MVKNLNGNRKIISIFNIFRKLFYLVKLGLSVRNIMVKYKLSPVETEKSAIFSQSQKGKKVNRRSLIINHFSEGKKSWTFTLTYKIA